MSTCVVHDIGLLNGWLYLDMVFFCQTATMLSAYFIGKMLLVSAMIISVIFQYFPYCHWNFLHHQAIEIDLIRLMTNNIQFLLCI